MLYEGVTLFDLPFELLLVHPRQFLAPALLSPRYFSLHPGPDRALELPPQLNELIGTSGTISCSLAMRCSPSTSYLESIQI